MKSPKELLQAGDALLIVDVQVDFCPGGALPIEDGHQVVDYLNPWIQAAHAMGIPVVFSRDWHPSNHSSFKENGGPWPAHCVQGSEGAKFHPDLTMPEGTKIVTSGTGVDQDGYSAFEDTDLDDFLRKNNVKRLWVGGLAQDVCVTYGTLDALELGFKVHVLLGGTRAITPEGGKEAVEKMRQAGAVIEEA